MVAGSSASRSETPDGEADRAIAPAHVRLLDHTALPATRVEELAGTARRNAAGSRRDLTYARSGAEPQKDIASDITVAGDKVQWTRWESEQARSRGSPPGQRVEAPIDAVKNISVCKPGCRGRGALAGAGLGAAAGLLLSAVLVSTAGHSNEGIDFSPFVWTAGPVLGALIGTLIGTRGVPTNIEFQPAPVRQ